MRKGPSPSSSSLPCAVPILLVIVCCCSLLLPCSCSGFAAADQGNDMFAEKGAGYSFPAGGRVPVQWPTPPQPGPPIRQGGGSSGSGGGSVGSGGGGHVYAQAPPPALAPPHREDLHPRPRCKNLHDRRN